MRQSGSEPATEPQPTNAEPGVRATVEHSPSSVHLGESARLIIGRGETPPVSLYVRHEGRLGPGICCDYDEAEDGTRTDGILLVWPDGRIQSDPSGADVARWMRTVAGQPYSGPRE